MFYQILIKWHNIFAVERPMGNNFSMGPKFYIVVKYCKYSMCPHFQKDSSFICMKCICQSPSMENCFNLQKNKQGIYPTRAFPQRDSNFSFTGKMSLGGVQKIKMETRLTYNCAHLRSTKERLTIWVKIFWLKIF